MKKKNATFFYVSTEVVEYVCSVLRELYKNRGKNHLRRV